MLVHNRRKRNEWLLVQGELHRRELEAANDALAAGTANEDQMLLINRERARAEADREKLNKKGVFVRAKEALFSGMDKEEKKGGTLGLLADGQKGESNLGEGVLRAVEDTVRGGKERLAEGKDGLKTEIRQHTPARPAVGGPLDELAQRAASDASSSTKSWTDWVLRK
jgi:hypothetical protein